MLGYAVVERFFGSLKHYWLLKIPQQAHEHMIDGVQAYYVNTINVDMIPIEYENCKQNVSEISWQVQYDLFFNSLKNIGFLVPLILKNNKKQKHLTTLFFILIQLIFLGYILRDIVPYNFEIVFIPILILISFLRFNYKRETMDPLIIFIFILILLYIFLVMLVSVFHAPLGSDGWKNIKITLNIFGFVAIFFIIVTLRPSESFFWFTMAGASLIIISLTILELSHIGVQGLTELKRLGSIHSNPIKYGLYANGLFVIMFGGFLWALQKGKSVFIFWMLLVLANLFAVIYSNTRTAWIGWPEAIFGWGLFYSFILYRSRLSVFKKAMVIIAPLTIVVAVLSMSSNVFEKRILLAVKDISEYVSGEQPLTSLGSRFLMYEAAVLMIIDSPLIGHGADKFQLNLKSTTSKILNERYNVEHPGLHYSHIHNQFFMSAVNYGILVAVLLFVILLFIIAYFTVGVSSASILNKPIWIAGLVFSIASLLSFLPESPLESTGYSVHYFTLWSVLLGFTVVQSKSSENV